MSFRCSTQWSSMRREVSLLVLALAICGLPSHVFAVNLHDGLVAYWPLDDGTADPTTTTAVDEFGLENDEGQLRNGPTWLTTTDAILGTSALRFDGLSQDVLVSDSFDLNISTNAVSISAWVNLDTLPSALTNSFGGIYDSDQDAYVLYLDRGNQELRFKVTDADGTAERPGIPEPLLATGQWNHVLGVYDGSQGVAKIYLNGTRVDQHLNAALIDQVRTGQLASIGGNPTLDVGNPNAYPLPGAIDDLGIWNRPLGRAEAEYLYNSGAGHAVGAANPNLAFIDDDAVVAVEPSALPVIHYAFEGNLINSGTGGPALNGTLIDTPGVNNNLYGPGSIGRGLDLRENPVSSATGGDAVSVAYELPDNGTIVFDFTVDKYYNFQSLWTNSVEPNDWEMWIYGDGRVRGRVQDNAFAEFDLDNIGGLDNTYQIGFTWIRDGDNVAVKLYIDGELVGQDLTGSWVPHPDSTFFIGGGDGTNHLGSGIFDEFRIYDVALSDGEMLYLARAVPEPTSGLMLLVAIGGAALTARRRR
ncbi:MAG: PEP-CTERM sorting domain-containing protein [Planctomycetales bacterium]|nr:PEP-CTERM sorting domain-containing protein [Planctomycetales bacterium]